MKKCPYCSEEIQDEAIKCRYCNEWLDGRNTLSGIFNRMKSGVKQQIQDYNSNKNDYLNPPTPEKPLKIDVITLYTDKVGWNNQYLLFRNIDKIFFECIPRDPRSDIPYSLYFTLFFTSDSHIKKFKIFWEGERESALGKKISPKVREQIKLMYNCISKATFKSRFAKYLDEFSGYGFINYGRGYKIYKNGDIFFGNEFKANIKEASDSGRFDMGLRSEPYELYIYKEAGSFGLSPGTGFFTRKEDLLVHISYSLDNDVISIFLFELLLNSKKIDHVSLREHYCL